jgi:hypothetical protein
MLVNKNASCVLPKMDLDLLIKSELKVNKEFILFFMRKWFDCVGIVVVKNYTIKSYSETNWLLNN